MPFRFSLLFLLLTAHARAAVIASSWAYRTPYSRPGWSGKPSTNITGDLQYAHMPQFVNLPNGSIALAWQGSPLPYEGSAKQALYWSTSDDSGRSWTAPSVLRAPRNQLPLWGPILHTNNSNSLVLFYSASNVQCRWGGETGQGAWSPGGDILMSVSYDNGLTWGSDVTILSFAEGRPIPKVLANQLVVTEGGRWVLPYWYEQGGECRGAPDLHGVPGVLTSDDEVHKPLLKCDENLLSCKVCAAQIHHRVLLPRVRHGRRCAFLWAAQPLRHTHGSSNLRLWRFVSQLGMHSVLLKWPLIPAMC